MIHTPRLLNFVVQKISMQETLKIQVQGVH